MSAGSDAVLAVWGALAKGVNYYRREFAADPRVEWLVCATADTARELAEVLEGLSVDHVHTLLDRLRAMGDGPTEDDREAQRGRCDCGAALQRIVGGGVDALTCELCNPDSSVLEDL